MLVLLLVPAVLLLGYLVFVLHWIRAWRVDRTIPVLSGALPIIGQSHKIMGNSAQLWEYIRNLSLETNEKGGIAKAWLGPMPYYLVSDPDMALKLTNSCLQKHYLYKFASAWIGEGLITAYESTWRRHRKLLNPTFNQHILDGFLEAFNRQSEYLTERLSVQAGKGQFNHWPYLADNALETVCKTVFGIQAANKNVIDHRYKAAVARIFDLLVNRFMKIWLHADFIYKHTSAKKSEDETVKVLKDMSSNIIQQKKALFNNRFIENQVEDTGKGRKFKTFLDLLLELGEQGSLTEQEIREEVDGMIVAAHDTSSTAIMYILVDLGSLPEVQQKVYEEIMKVMGHTDRDVDKEDLNKFIYMEAVIKESLRFYSVAPIFARCTTEDVQIDKHIIPNGCGIIFSIYGIHRSKCWGDDAHDFRPERWFEPTLPTHPGAFAAFSLGRRGCFGKSYAMMSMKTNLVHLLRRYSVTADHTKMKFKFDVMLKPESGHYISIEERKKVQLK